MKPETYCKIGRFLGESIPEIFKLEKELEDNRRTRDQERRFGPSSVVSGDERGTRYTAGTQPLPTPEWVEEAAIFVREAERLGKIIESGEIPKQLKYTRVDSRAANALHWLLANYGKSKGLCEFGYPKAAKEELKLFFEQPLSTSESPIQPLPNTQAGPADEPTVQSGNIDLSALAGLFKIIINNRFAPTGLKIGDTFLMNTFILNTTIAVPSEFPATFEMKEVSIEEATNILNEEFTSAIGHVGSAEAIEAVTGINPQVNRIQIQASLKTGDRALCFKLNGRLSEGAIIDAEACAEIGFSFILMIRTV